MNNIAFNLPEIFKNQHVLILISWFFILVEEKDRSQIYFESIQWIKLSSTEIYYTIRNYHDDNVKKYTPNYRIKSMSIIAVLDFTPHKRSSSEMNVNSLMKMNIPKDRGNAPILFITYNRQVPFTIWRCSRTWIPILLGDFCDFSLYTVRQGIQ